MNRPFTYCLLTLLLTSCVSESEHQKVIQEKNTLYLENQKLKDEIEDIKFGASKLLTNGKLFYEAKDFSNAKKHFEYLLQKHPDAPESIEAKEYLSNIDEEEIWYNAVSSEEISYTEYYISKYPTGKYINKALLRENELMEINMGKNYEEAVQTNSSYIWKRFLDDYPDYFDASAIREKIIRLEVDEILNDRETGKMPLFNQYSSSYSSNSSVQITNNTGCNLTVRYSGPNAEIIQIPEGGIRTVYLLSGNYKIAASACGANYAGKESLQGNYDSTFYISTSKY